MPASKVAVLVAPSLIKAEQRFQIRVRNRPPISASRESRKDLPRAGKLVARVCGPAYKNAPAGCGVASASRVERPFDREPVHGRIAGDVQAIYRGPKKRLYQIVFDRMTAQNRVRRNRVNPRLHMHAGGQLLIQIRAELSRIRSHLQEIGPAPDGHRSNSDSVEIESRFRASLPSRASNRTYCATAGP